MELYSGYINRLIEELSALPGIGNKSAQRLAFHIIGMSPARVNRLAETIRDAKEHVTFCKVCQNLTDEEMGFIVYSVAGVNRSDSIARDKYDAVVAAFEGAVSGKVIPEGN